MLSLSMYDSFITQYDSFYHLVCMIHLSLTLFTQSLTLFTQSLIMLLSFNQQSITLSINSNSKMYFEEQNLFTSLNHSNQDLQKMINLSASNDQYILESGNFGKSHFQSNQHNVQYSSFGQPKNALVIDSDNSQLNSSGSSSIFKNTYSKYETQIKSLLPQIHSHLIEKHYNQFSHNHQQRLEKYKTQITLNYQKKIESKIDQIKENINSNLSSSFQHINHLKEQINYLKKSQKDHKKSLTGQQEQQLVERTVSEIFGSQKLLNEIRQKLKPKVEERVRFILIRDLEKQLTKCQNQIEDKIAEERQEFKQKRKMHWQKQAESELKELAVEFEQLKQKKGKMEEAVKEKMIEKQNVMRKYKEGVERLKQAKQLQKKIKQMEEKFTKGNINTTKRTNSKSIEKKVGKRH